MDGALVLDDKKRACINQLHARIFSQLQVESPSFGRNLEFQEDLLIHLLHARFQLS